MIASGFHHEIRVGWSDCDPANIAYTGRIPDFALEAIDVWWEHHLGHGWYQINRDLGFGTPFVHLSIDFRKPITPDHRLICVVNPNKLGTTSVGFNVMGYQDDALCFEGNFVCVFVKAPSMQKIAAPEHVEAIIRPLLENQENVTC